MEEGRRVSSIEDLAAGGIDVDLQVVPLPLARIRRNPANPNVIRPDLLDTLREDIRENGFTQPILVRPVEGDEDHDYELVDGEHRHRVLEELGATVVPAVVTEADDTEAALRLLTMNRLRGSFVPIRMAKLLVRLNETVGEKELMRRLGMEQFELRDHLRLADFGGDDEVAQRVRAAIEADQAAAPVTLSFVLSQRDAKVAERVLAPLVDEGDKQGRSKALMKALRAYEKAAKEAS